MMACLACLGLLCSFAALAPAIKVAQRGNHTVIKDVEYAKGLINCGRGLVNDSAGKCEEKPLLLDVYPAYATDTESGPLFPAILLAHGAGNSGGKKTNSIQVQRAITYARRGFVVFVPDYRVESDAGSYPGTDFQIELSPWRSLYPAVRDVKAAARFIKARAKEYGVDKRRIVASGTSAGGMDVLAAFTSSRNAFTKEMSLEDDPTLNTTNVDMAPKVRAIVVHSGPPWGIQQYERFLQEQPESARFASTWASQNEQGMSFVDSPPPLIQFHGGSDTYINVSNAEATQELYTSKGVRSELHVLEGKGHCDWTFGCDVNIGGYCTKLDTLAIDFIYKAFKAAA